MLRRTSAQLAATTMPSSDSRSSLSPAPIVGGGIIHHHHRRTTSSASTLLLTQPHPPSTPPPPPPPPRPISFLQFLFGEKPAVAAQQQQQDSEPSEQEAPSYEVWIVVWIVVWIMRPELFVLPCTALFCINAAMTVFTQHAQYLTSTRTNSMLAG